MIDYKEGDYLWSAKLGYYLIWGRHSVILAILLSATLAIFLFQLKILNRAYMIIHLRSVPLMC